MSVTSFALRSNGKSVPPASIDMTFVEPTLTEAQSNVKNTILNHINNNHIDKAIDELLRAIRINCENAAGILTSLLLHGDQPEAIKSFIWAFVFSHQNNANDIISVMPIASAMNFLIKIVTSNENEGTSRAAWILRSMSNKENAGIILQLLLSMASDDQQNLLARNLILAVTSLDIESIFLKMKLDDVVKFFINLSEFGQEKGIANSALTIFRYPEKANGEMVIKIITMMLDINKEIITSIFLEDFNIGKRTHYLFALEENKMITLVSSIILHDKGDGGLYTLNRCFYELLHLKDKQFVEKQFAPRFQENIPFITTVLCAVRKIYPIALDNGTLKKYLLSDDAYKIIRRHIIGEINRLENKEDVHYEDNISDKSASMSPSHEFLKNESDSAVIPISNQTATNSSQDSLENESDSASIPNHNPMNTNLAQDSSKNKDLSNQHISPKIPHVGRNIAIILGVSVVTTALSLLAIFLIANSLSLWPIVITAVTIATLITAVVLRMKS
ncbi:MAG: hypothetical protein LBI69_01235 [Puniceicoccales bacterium]|nr:hypothetical protein [Puniceicoccales bacterium]